MKSKKFLLNTKDINSPAAQVCIFGLKKELEKIGHIVDINIWDDYRPYDYVIFMSGSEEIDKARNDNSKLMVGLADPKPNSIENVIKSDFCLVSSYEQREVFLKFNKNLFVYYMIPNFDSYSVVHKKKTLYKIFYHGNKIHLNTSYYGLTPALNQLGKKYNIEFNVIYNIDKLGKWRIGRPDPKNCVTNDLQWYPNCYKDYFSEADIGVVQNFMPIKENWMTNKINSVSKNLFLENREDYFLRFKFSNNAGRAFVFGYFNIPVVGENTPALSDAIKNDYSGKLVLTPEGWYDAIEDLILSSVKRKKFAINFKNDIDKLFQPSVSTEKLIVFLKDLNQIDPINIKLVKPKLLKENFIVKLDKIKRALKKINILQ